MSQSHNEIVIFDTEYWTDDGVKDRNWSGLFDPPPFLIQIGAFKVKLDNNLTVIDDFVSFVIPQNRDGQRLPLTEFFTSLTNITEDDLKTKGVKFDIAIKAFKDFTGERPLYSYGYDIESSILPSCYFAGVECPFTIEQSRNVAKVLYAAGVSETDILENTSGSLAGHFGLELDNHHVHDARCDAYSILVTLRYLIEQGRLKAQDMGRSFRFVDNIK